MSDQVLITQCAPTLAGFKTGSLFTCPYTDRRQLARDLRRLNRMLRSRGLRVIPLLHSQHRALIYVYRPKELAADLSGEVPRQILQQAGYESITANRCVLELIRRLSLREDFPHEIGLFLGYPPEDVQGFIENKGAGYKCVGCWKVYGDEQAARETFDRYRRCTDALCSRWKSGVRMEQLVAAV